MMALAVGPLPVTLCLSYQPKADLVIRATQCLVRQFVKYVRSGTAFLRQTAPTLFVSELKTRIGPRTKIDNVYEFPVPSTHFRDTTHRHSRTQLPCIYEPSCLGSPGMRP